jgi:hypothetical protein
MKLTAMALALVTLGGCTAVTADAPRVPYTPFQGASISANRAAPGSEAFCQQFASQSAADRYELERDGDGGAGFARAIGEAEGRRAYQGCLAGDTRAPGTLGSLLR